MQRYEWNRDSDPQAAASRLLPHLQDSVLLAPMDRGYAAIVAGRSPELERIAADRSLGIDLLMASPARALAFAEQAPAPIRRLIDRGTPGPLVIELRSAGGTDRIRVPRHPAVRAALSLLDRPALAVELPEQTVDAASTHLASLGETLASAGVLLSDAALLGVDATVVRPSGEGVEIVREGILSGSRVRRLSAEIITFVCTGNSCRSPMAEVLFKRLLAERLGCPAEELAERGYWVVSAGLAASDGGPASAGSVEAVAELGASLAEHVSQSLTPEMIRFSDRLVVMTRDHASIIATTVPEAAEKTSRLAGDRDIADPVGRPIESYRACAAEIQECLSRLLESVRPGSSAA